MQLPLPLLSWIKENVGVHITSSNQGAVTLALRAVADSNNLEVTQYIMGLLNNQIDPQSFIDHVTTHESFFLRHQTSMESVVKEIIPDLIRKGINPRILSMPCAQGEEPYSLLMLMQERAINLSKINVIGIDIAASSIQKAREGIYSDYALRQVPLGFLQRHFIRIPGTNPQQYRVNPEIQKHTTFAKMNLLIDVKSKLNASKFHIIFCQNLLIYFDGPTIKTAISILKSLLHPDGYLIVDATEGPYVSQFLKPVLMGSAMLFKHSEAKSETKKTQPQNWKSLYPKDGTEANKDISNGSKEITKVTAKPVQANIFEASKKLKKQIELKRQVETERNIAIKITLEKAQNEYQKKRFKESIILFDQLMKDYPKLAAKVNLGKAQIFADEGKCFQALETAEMALAETSITSNTHLSELEKAEAHAIIIIVLNEKGMKKDTKFHLKKLIQLNPKHPLAALSL